MNDGIHRRVAATEGLAFNTLKTLIHWGDDLKLDEGDLDQQHQRIFKLALEASDLSRDAGDIDQLRAVLDEFGTALREHFLCEEASLADIGQARLDAHRAEHNAMLGEFEFIRERVAHNAEGWTFQEEALAILNFMIGVTVGHILHSDKDLHLLNAAVIR
jgi:hemerythrin